MLSKTKGLKDLKRVPEDMSLLSGEAPPSHTQFIRNIGREQERGRGTACKSTVWVAGHQEDSWAGAALLLYLSKSPSGWENSAVRGRRLDHLCGTVVR